MALTPQQKLLHVAQELGISDMKNMQGSTGVLYHRQDIATGPGASQPNFTFFGGALQGAEWITDTNVNTDAKLEVNEAMLIEKIQFNTTQNYGGTTSGGNFWQCSGSSRYIGAIIDVYVGNKRVLKQVRNMSYNPMFNGISQQYYEQTEVYLEGAGIVIPPQVEFYVNAYLFNWNTGLPLTAESGYGIACSLYGTRALLNLNTTL